MPESRREEMVAALAPFRRRLRRAAFVRAVPPTLCIALAAVEIGLVMARPSVSWAAATLSMVVAACGLIAALVALVRTPTTWQTAAIVDRYFALEDLALTAVQFAADDHVVSRAITDTARRRLSQCQVSALTIAPPIAAWLTVVPIVAAPVVLALLAVPSVDARERVAAGGVATSASASTRSGEPARARRGAGRATAAGDQPRPASSAAVTRESTSSAIAPPAAQSSTDGAHQQSSRVETSRVGTSPTRNDPRAEASRPSSLVDAEGGASTSRENNVARRAGSDAAGKQGSGSGAGAGARLAEDAGGVAGGALAASGDGRRSPDALRAQGYDAQYRRARANAESAIARQQVPARLRPYVRAYFLAIRPGGGPS